MKDIPENIPREVESLVSSLVSGNLSDMYSQGLFGASDLDVISEVIDAYTGKMTMPPDFAFLDFDIYEDAVLGHFSADFAL